jgi:hypothetical protein
VLPYVALPLAAVVGAVLLLPAATRLAGELLLLVGVGGLGVLALGLTISGLSEEARYPGLKFRALEIPRRWATLYGAFRGLLTYGWSGRRGSDGGHPGKP